MSADLYIAPVTSKGKEDIYPALRREYIESAATKEVKDGRYSVWKLLEYALFNSFGINIKETSFTKNENGRWECDKCFFSLSHTKDAVAVAVSASPVGADIEKSDRVFKGGIETKILTEAELFEFSVAKDEKKQQFLLQKWCAKESIFKKIGGKTFLPHKIDSADAKICAIDFSGGQYICAVSGDTLINIYKIKGL